MQSNPIPGPLSAKRPRFSTPPVDESSTFKTILPKFSSIRNRSDATNSSHQAILEMEFADSIGDVFVERQDVQHEVSNPKHCSTSPSNPFFLSVDSCPVPSSSYSGYETTCSKNSAAHEDILSRAQESGVQVITRNRWTEEEDERLKTCVNVYGEKWREIVTHFPHRTKSQCRLRWTRSITSKLLKESWTKEEDVKLIRLVVLYGSRWKYIAQHFEHSRLAEDCRARWYNIVLPAINKAPWTDEENRVIHLGYKLFGNRWAKIAELLRVRTAESIKKQFTMLLIKERIMSETVGRQDENTETSNLKVNACSSEENINKPCDQVIHGDEDPSTGSTPRQHTNRILKFTMSSVNRMLEIIPQYYPEKRDSVGAQAVDNIGNPLEHIQLFHNGKHLMPLLEENLHHCTDCLFYFTSQEELSSHIDTKHSKKIENIRDKFVFEDDVSDDDDFETCNEDILSCLMNEPEENSDNSNISVDQKCDSNYSVSRKGNKDIKNNSNGFCEMKDGLNF